MNTTRCLRCLLYEDAENLDIYQTVKEYVDGLDDDVKTPQKAYLERLERCKVCDMLLSGMCRKCGCYVEMRAAVKTNSCPGKHW